MALVLCLYPTHWVRKSSDLRMRSILANKASAYMIVTAAEISTNYVAQDWHTYLILLLLLVVQGVIAMQSTKVIGWVKYRRTGSHPRSLYPYRQHRLTPA